MFDWHISFGGFFCKWNIYDGCEETGPVGVPRAGWASHWGIMPIPPGNSLYYRSHDSGPANKRARARTQLSCASHSGSSASYLFTCCHNVLFSVASACSVSDAERASPCIMEAGGPPHLGNRLALRSDLILPDVALSVVGRGGHFGVPTGMYPRYNYRRDHMGVQLMGTEPMIMLWIEWLRCALHCALMRDGGKAGRVMLTFSLSCCSLLSFSCLICGDTGQGWLSQRKGSSSRTLYRWISSL